MQEYFAFDSLGYWSEALRLKGWRYQNGQPVEIKPNEQGWLWSEQLALWVVEEDSDLRLYNSHRQLLLTEAEEEHQRATQAEDRAERVEDRAERAEETIRQLESERAVHEALLAKLQARGIDPDNL